MVKALSSEDKSLYGNPWRPEQWNITTQGAFVVRYGVAKANEFAKAAGVNVGDLRPHDPNKPTRVVEVRNFLLGRRGGTSNSSIIGAGSSGDGPPE